MRVYFDNVHFTSMCDTAPTIEAYVSLVLDTTYECAELCKEVNTNGYGYISNRVAKAILNCTGSGNSLPSIKNVYFNEPVTVVLWDDNTKTIVKCQNGDTYSRETGLALCMAKKAMGNKSNFNDIFKKWIPEEKKPTSERLCSNCKYRDRSWGVGDESCFECTMHGDRRFWKPKK